MIAEYDAATGVPFLSVDHRLAPEAEGPRPAQDENVIHAQNFTTKPGKMTL